MTRDEFKEAVQEHYQIGGDIPSIIALAERAGAVFEPEVIWEGRNHRDTTWRDRLLADGQWQHSSPSYEAGKWFDLEPSDLHKALGERLLAERQPVVEAQPEVGTPGPWRANYDIQLRDGSVAGAYWDGYGWAFQAPAEVVAWRYRGTGGDKWTRMPEARPALDPNRRRVLEAPTAGTYLVWRRGIEGPSTAKWTPRGFEITQEQTNVFGYPFQPVVRHDIYAWQPIPHNADLKGQSPDSSPNS